MKDTKDSELLHFSALNFVLFATSFENRGRVLLEGNPSIFILCGRA